MPKKRIKSDHCTNCGEDFRNNLEATEFCPVCGQENHNPRLPIHHAVLEFIIGVVHIDNKTLRSVKTIILKPGQITKDWIEGRRARYSSPFQLFIWATALFTLNWFLLIDFNESFFSLSDETKSQSQQFDELPDTSVLVLSGQTTLPFIEHPKLPVSELRVLKNIPDQKIPEWLTSHNIPDNFYFFLLIKGFKNRINSLQTLKNYIKKFTGYVNIFLIVSLPIIAFIFYFCFYKKDMLYYDALVFNLHYHVFVSIVYLILSWPLALIMVHFQLDLGIFIYILIVS